MNITKEWLIEKEACEKDIEWFLNQNETDIRVIVENLIKENNWETANWLMSEDFDEQRYGRETIRERHLRIEKRVAGERDYRLYHAQEEKEIQQWWEEEENRVINRDGWQAWLAGTGRQGNEN